MIGYFVSITCRCTLLQAAYKTNAAPATTPTMATPNPTTPPKTGPIDAALLELPAADAVLVPELPAEDALPLSVLATDETALAPEPVTEARTEDAEDRGLESVAVRDSPALADEGLVAEVELIPVAWVSALEPALLAVRGHCVSTRIRSDGKVWDRRAR